MINKLLCIKYRDVVCSLRKNYKHEKYTRIRNIKKRKILLLNKKCISVKKCVVSRHFIDNIINFGGKSKKKCCWVQVTAGELKKKGKNDDKLEQTD